MSKHLLSTSDLHHAFAGIQALNGISLSVEKGELFGIIGPDGAGKSTLIRSILGIIEPDQGDIQLFGEDRRKNRNLVKTRAGYLSQQFSLYEDLTVNENIEFFAQIHGVENFNDRRFELLEFTRMTPFGNRLAGKLSGGMKQKLALACTLIHKPEILFLDEPTTGVDPLSRRDFWKILFDLLKTGLTIIVATPYMDEAERCHRIALIHKGKLIAVATPETLKNELGLKVLEIMAADPRKLLAMLKSGFPETDMHLVGERVHLLFNPSHIDPDKFINSVSNKNEITSWRVTEPSMETVFIQKIGQG